jgi:hypothetical protein
MSGHPAPFGDVFATGGIANVMRKSNDLLQNPGCNLNVSIANPCGKSQLR